MIGVLVPRRLRADWRQEWEAELQWREAQLTQWDKLNLHGKLDLWRRSLGAFTDALLLQPRRMEDEMLQDFFFGLRLLKKHWGFTVIAVATLGLGIGVNTALFTGLNLFLRPKPIKDPETVVTLEQSRNAYGLFSYADYVFYRDHAQSFVAVLPSFYEKILLGASAAGSAPEEIQGAFVAEHHLAELGGTTQLGRFFTADENRVAGRDAVLVLSHHFWQRQFGGDPQVIGQTVLLNGKSFTVLGVTNPSFVGLRAEAPDVWLPLMMRATMPTVHFEEVAEDKRDWFGGQDFQWLSLHARLRPGQTMAAAQAELTLLASQRPRAATAVQERITVGQLHRLMPEFWRMSAMVMGASLLVLLIACSNIANMLLARAAARQKEIGVRLALGATRFRIVRQLLIESFLLSLLGGAVGVLLAWWCVGLLMPWAAERAWMDSAKLALNLAPDGRVLGFALLLSLLSGLLFGLVPALRATRTDLMLVIKDESAAAGGRNARSWLRNGLVVAQVALCLALLIPAGLLVRGLTKALTTDPGFETKKLMLVHFSLELSGYDDARMQLFARELPARLRRLPGVESAGAMYGFGGNTLLILPDATGTRERQVENVPFRWVTADYFDTIGTPILQGRGFTEAEAQAKAPVVILSESAARNLWPNENPLGKTLRAERRLRDGTRRVEVPTAQVIGVARDAQTRGVGATPALFFYAPFTPKEFADTFFLARTTRDAVTMKELFRREAYALEPVLRLDTVTMEERMAVEGEVSRARSAADLATSLGGLALLLAALGIYGVMAFSVAERTREIGIRMALGAAARNVQLLILRQSLRLVLLGILLGLPLAVATTHILKSFLFGLSRIDPLTWGGIVLLLSLVAVLASWLPARRAARVDPMIALRHD